MEVAAPFDLLRPRRQITGMSAVLLAHFDGEIDWPAFDAHVTRTAAAGLVPAVNMDTGFVALLSSAARDAVLGRASSLLAGESFVAGAFVDDADGAALDVGAYARACEAIAGAGGLPIVFPSHGSCGRELELYGALGERLDRFLGFELGPMFLPTGRILSLDEYRDLLRIDACIGAKHSSLRRDAEWDRLRLRDELRPDFLVLTGNDLAIDMVMFGSDYLLGLSTFAPDLFAERDRRWAYGDPSFFELNDRLQALGAFAFREPVPAYRHDAALFLQLRGWLPDAGRDCLPMGAPHRADETVERDVLRELAAMLDLEVVA